MRLPSSTRPLHPPRLSPTSKTPITYTFRFRPVLLLVGAFRRSPVEWNSNVGWDEIDTLYVAPHLAHMCSPSFLHSFRLHFNPYPGECLRLSPPCSRQVNFRRCTVTAANYERYRSAERSRTRIMTTIKRMQAVLCTQNCSLHRLIHKHGYESTLMRAVVTIAERQRPLECQAVGHRQ